MCILTCVLKRLCDFALSVRYSCCFHGYDKKDAKPHAYFFNLIKDEYHLELIIYCIYLYVGGGMCCNDP